MLLMFSGMQCLVHGQMDPNQSKPYICIYSITVIAITVTNAWIGCIVGGCAYGVLYTSIHAFEQI